jgi:peptide/nickel transport system permease protein
MATTTPLDSVGSELAAGRARRGLAEFARRNPTIVAGGAILAFMTAVALLAPWIAGDPIRFDPVDRLQPPSARFWFGTDNLGRDVYARTVYGARISLVVGLLVATAAMALGLVIGLVAGFYRTVDGVAMRVMDGIMAIPAILLAIALVALTRASVEIVILAIAIPEIPRVVRLVRSVVLTVREQPYVDAAIASGTRPARILFRHVLPNTVAPLIVQATYIVASAVIIEAALSFLGAGVPPEIPTWGNMIAEARLFLQIAPWPIFFPGLCLAILVLAVNIMGDGLRDRLDPRIARRM